MERWNLHLTQKVIGFFFRIFAQVTLLMLFSSLAESVPANFIQRFESQFLAPKPHQENETTADKNNGLEDTFTMEKILKQRVKRGKKEYLIKWRGWGMRYATWEPEGMILYTLYTN